jgi:hypothetical protein
MNHIAAPTVRLEIRESLPNKGGAGAARSRR